MKKILISLLMCTLISCAHQPQPTQAMQINSQLHSILQRMNDETNSCARKNNDNASSKVVNEQIMFASLTSPNKIELLTNNNKISDEQKVAMLEYLKKNSQCREIRLKALGSNTYLSPLLIAQQKYNSQLDDVYVKLINKEITISEANKLKDTYAQNLSIELEYGWKQTQSSLDAMHNNENSNRIAEQQRQSQILQNYMIMQNANRPITTNCTAYGNQTNCTTR